MLRRVVWRYWHIWEIYTFQNHRQPLPPLMLCSVGQWLTTSYREMCEIFVQGASSLLRIARIKDRGCIFHDCRHYVETARGVCGGRWLVEDKQDDVKVDDLTEITSRTRRRWNLVHDAYSVLEDRCLLATPERPYFFWSLIFFTRRLRSCWEAVPKGESYYPPRPS